MNNYSWKTLLLLLFYLLVELNKCHITTSHLPTFTLLDILGGFGNAVLANC